MIAHNENVGRMLTKLDELGIVSHQDWLPTLFNLDAVMRQLVDAGGGANH